MWASFATGAVLAGMGIGHCTAMCGPLAAASCAQRSHGSLWRYQWGRTAGYVSFGGLAGDLGASVALLGSSAWASWVFPVIAAMGCIALAHRVWFRKPRALVQLRVQEQRKPSLFTRVAGLVPQDPLALGLLSSLLPCGLLATALLAAAATRSAPAGAVLMLGFVTVSGAALAGTGLLVARLPRAPAWLRQLTGCILVATAGWMLVRPISSLLQPADNHAVKAAPLCHGGLHRDD